MRKIRIYFFYDSSYNYSRVLTIQNVLGNTLPFDIDFRPLQKEHELIMAQAYGINDKNPTLVILDEKNTELYRMSYYDVEKFIEETRGFILSYEW